MGTGVFGQFFLAGNRMVALHLATGVFWWEIILVTSNRMREEATKFEKIKQRNPSKD